MKKVVLGISMMLAAFGMTAVAQTNTQNNNNNNVCCNQQAVCTQAQQCANTVCNGDSAAAPGKKKDKAYRNGKKGHHGKAALRGDSAARKNGKQPRFAANGKNKKFSDRTARLAKTDKSRKLTTTLFNGITLTADQQSRLDALNQKMATERNEARTALKEKTAEAKAAAKKVKEQARADYDKGVKDILTAEQYAKFELNQKEMQTRKSAKTEARKAKSEARKLKAEMSKATTTSTAN